MNPDHVAKYYEITDNVGNFLIDWARPVGWTEGPTATWPLADFRSAITIALGYLAFVFLGRTIMPLLPAIPGLYPFKFIYNIVQVMLCSYMCIEAGVRAYSSGYHILPCNHFDKENPPIAFILWGQLSFLHVYHHFSIFLFYWLNVNVGYDGDVYLTIVLNGFIHTIMYTYYFVSLHSKDIWWKSALTLSQIVQFVVMNSQAGYLIATGCTAYPRNIIIAYLYYIISLLVLFINFFVASYVSKRSKSKKSKSN